MAMVRILWEDALQYWRSLPSSGEMGTCTIALTAPAEMMTVGGEWIEIVRVQQYIGAAQAACWGR